MATSTQLKLRWSILGPPNAPLTMPDLLEQIRYLVLMEPPQKIARGNGVGENYSQGGWRFIDEHIPIWFESAWDANIARYLQFLQDWNRLKGWEYRPKTFKIPGIRGGYTPSFRIVETDDSSFFFETGDTDAAMDLFEKTVYFQDRYPRKRLVLLEKEWFIENLAALRKFIPEWEG